GLSAGGGAYSPALTDWVVMTEQSSMFLTGPGVVRDALGEDVSADQLGGTRVHERNGVCHFVAPTDSGAAYLARELLGYLPRHRDARPLVLPARPPLGYDPSSPVPSDPRRIYDVRDVIRALVDGGELLEVAVGWARNLVTGFAHAFAEAEVPRVTLIVGKAFGGAYITMNSKDLGADYVFAWPDAQIGVMAARSAVGIIHRRELAAAEDRDATHDSLAARYAE